MKLLKWCNISIQVVRAKERIDAEFDQIKAEEESKKEKKSEKAETW